MPTRTLRLLFVVALAAVALSVASAGAYAQDKVYLWDRFDTDIVVNATSIGLYPDVDARLNIDEKSLLPSMLVADVIPNPPRTQLVKEAENCGCTVIDGLGMLVNQGVIGVEYWTGISPDPAVMRAALEEVFGD